MTAFAIRRTSITFVRIIALAIIIGAASSDADVVAARTSMLAIGDTVTEVDQSVSCHGSSSYRRGRIGFLAE